MVGSSIYKHVTSGCPVFTALLKFILYLQSYDSWHMNYALWFYSIIDRIDNAPSWTCTTYRSYYSVLVGWCAYYLVISVVYDLPVTLADSNNIWDYLQVPQQHALWLCSHAC